MNSYLEQLKNQFYPYLKISNKTYGVNKKVFVILPSNFVKRINDLKNADVFNKNFLDYLNTSPVCAYALNKNSNKPESILDYDIVLLNTFVYSVLSKLPPELVLKSSFLKNTGKKDLASLIGINLSDAYYSLPGSNPEVVSFNYDPVKRIPLLKVLPERILSAFEKSTLNIGYKVSGDKSYLVYSPYKK